MDDSQQKRPPLNSPHPRLDPLPCPSPPPHFSRRPCFCTQRQIFPRFTSISHFLTIVQIHGWLYVWSFRFDKLNSFSFILVYLKRYIYVIFVYTKKGKEMLIYIIETKASILWIKQWMLNYFGTGTSKNQQKLYRSLLCE